MLSTTRLLPVALRAGEDFDEAYEVVAPGTGFQGARVAGALRRYPSQRVTDPVLFGLALASDGAPTPGGSRLTVVSATADRLTYRVRLAPDDTAPWGFDEQYEFVPVIVLGFGSGRTVGAPTGLLFTVTGRV